MDMPNTDTMGTPIQIDTPTAAPEPIAIDDGVSPNVPLTPAIVESRAAKAHMGLENKVDKSKDEYTQAIDSGKESEIRKDVASQLDTSKTNQLNAQVSSGNFNPDSIDKLLAFTKPTSPDSVFEDHYAQEYADKIRWPTANPDTGSFLQDADKIFPGELDKTVNRAKDLIGKREFLATMRENSGTPPLVSTDPTIVALMMTNPAGLATLLSTDTGSIASYARGMIPLYSTIKSMGNVPGVGVEGILPGENEQAQRSELFHLDSGDFKSTVTQIYDNKKKNNPIEANAWLDRMISMTHDDRLLDDAFAVADVVGLGAWAKDILTAVKGAGKDLVRSTSIPPGITPPQAAAAASGDLAGAALQKEFTSKLNQLDGRANITTEAATALTSNYKVDMANVRADPGNFGQEIVNRLQEQYDAGENNYLDVLAYIQRVQRTPNFINANKETIEAFLAKVKENYRGLNNAVLNVEPPVWEANSNTYHYRINIGTSSGEMFQNADVAANNARLNGIVLKGGYSFKDLYTKATLESDIILAEDKLERINTQKSLALTQGSHEGLQLSEEQIEFGINNLTKGIANYKKQLEGIKPFESGATIEQQGSGFYISVVKPVNETEDFIRDNLITTKIGEYSKQQSRADLKSGTVSTGVPYSWANGVIPKLVNIRTPEDVLSQTENAQRNIAVHGPNLLLGVAEKNLEPLNALSGTLSTEKTSFDIIPKKRWEGFNRVLVHYQSMPDPENDGIPGYFAKGVGEFERDYMKVNGYLPMKEEILAYWAYKQNYEFERGLRTFAIVRNKARVGTESHSISTLDVNGKQVKSSFFDGIKQDVLPHGVGDNILFLGEYYGDNPVIKEAHNVPTRLRHEVETGLSSGQFNVIRVYDPSSRPLQGYGKVKDQWIRYVVTRQTPETKPIAWDQIPRRGGGHLVPDYDLYIKQAIVTEDNIGKKLKHRYEGDRMLMPISNRVDGEAISKHLAVVQRLIHGTEEDEAQIAAWENEGGSLAKVDREQLARDYSNKNLFEDWDEVSSWFKGKWVDGVRQPPKFSTREPFQVIHKDTLIGNLNKDLENRYPGTFVDNTRFGSDARMAQVEFTQERDARDLRTIVNNGTYDKPVYSYEPARLVDPITALNRGTARIAQSTYMDDYKIYAAEHFIQNAATYLEPNLSELRAAPFAYLMNPVWKKTKDPIGVRDIAIFKTQNRMIKDLIGSPSDTDLLLHSASQRLSDTIYKVTGKPGYAVTPEWLLPYVKNPLDFIRSMTFSAYLGLYTVKSFFTQLTTFTNILAISPLHAPQAAVSTLLYAWSKMNRNKDVLEALDKIASDFTLGLSTKGLGRFRNRDWLEATHYMEGSAFPTVSKEHSFIDSPLANRVIQRGADKFLDWGNAPFETGAASTRVAGWYTAWSEFRASKAVGAPTRQELATIGQRAKLLDHNMSRDSSSITHTGLASVPAQFFAYDIRLSEMMLGSRLTQAEKTRMILFSSLLYGVPAGGIGYYLFPASDYLREKAESKFGYRVGNDLLTSTVMEGIPSLLVAWATGGGDAHKGTWYNFSKFGTKGIDALGNLLDHDKTIWDFVGGAPYSMISNTWARSSNFRSFAYHFMIGDSKAFPFEMSDVLDIFTEVASISDVNKAWIALKTGNFLSKNGTLLEKDVTKGQALMALITGLTNQAASAYTLQQALEDDKLNEKKVINQIILNMRRGADADIDKDRDNASAYFIRANTLMRMYIPYEKWASTSKIAFDRTPLIDRVRFEYFLRNVPPNEKAIRQEQFRDTTKEQQ